MITFEGAHTSAFFYFNPLRAKHLQNQSSIANLKTNFSVYCSSFGMVMPGRNATANDQYSYGFQGQLLDDEIKGKGNSVNYKYRMHDPRIGRFFAVDPLASNYPQWTPYQFSGNQVIHTVELEGLEPAEDANDMELGEFGQGSDKESEENSIYNWYVGQGVGTKEWVKSDQYTQPEVSESAEMSNHVYSIDQAGVEAGARAGRSEWKLKEKYIGSDGFKAGLYSRTIEGETFYTLAFAGTDDAQDGLTDVVMGGGALVSMQSVQTIITTNKVAGVIKGEDYGFLHYTGHSLGGGLASIASMQKGNKATTFNAMGLTWAFEYGNPFAHRGSEKLTLINAYIIEGEILNTLQPSKAEGTQWIMKAEGNYNMADKHSIDRFLEMYRKAP